MVDIVSCTNTVIFNFSYCFFFFFLPLVELVEQFNVDLRKMDPQEIQFNVSR